MDIPLPSLYPLYVLAALVSTRCSDDAARHRLHCPGAVGSPTQAREWYVLKSSNFGANWSWARLPPFLQGVGDLVADPTSDTIYVISGGSCISHSADHAERWSPCWKAPGLTGRFRQLVVRDSMTMVHARRCGILTPALPLTAFVHGSPCIHAMLPMRGTR